LLGLIDAAAKLIGRMTGQVTGLRPIAFPIPRATVPRRIDKDDNMHAILRLLAGLACMHATAALASEPAKPKPPVVLTIATATPGGGFPVYGDSFALAVMYRDAPMIVLTRNTKGSGENIGLLEDKSVELALVQGETAHDALNGIGRPKADLRIIAAMYSAPGLFVVPAGSPYRTIADLKGRRIAFGAAGSGLVILARYVLDGIGLDQSKDFDAVLLERAGDGPDLVERGEVAALWGGGIAWPGFTAVAKQQGGARFIAPSADEIVRIRAKYPFLKTLDVPAGSFPGQTERLTSVGSWSFVMAHPDLDETAAYELAKALHRGETMDPPNAKAFPPLADTTARNTIDAVPRPELLHPGVTRYYREIGLMK
jgi:uncharacterized protein